MAIALSWTARAAIDLNEILNNAIVRHPLIIGQISKANAEQDKITPQYFPENPMVGIMKNGDMRSLTLSQELLFPTKYFLSAKIQREKFNAVNEELINQKLVMQQQITSSYFDILLTLKINEYYKLQKDLIEKIARIAESKRAVGQLSSQEEMKAHLEEANIEKLIIDNQQVLNDKLLIFCQLTLSDDECNLQRLTELFSQSKDELKEPKLKSSVHEIRELVNNSREDIPSVKIVNYKLAEAKSFKQLEGNSFLPDFKISYQKSLEDDSNNNEKIIGIELKFPLWFWGKETNNYSAASNQYRSVIYEKEQELRVVNSEVQQLLSKIESKEKILSLYKTTLIPQSESIISSSQANYKANRIGIMEILDSERTLFDLKIAYAQEVKEYIDAIRLLETKIGRSISSIPFGDIL